MSSDSPQVYPWRKLNIAPFSRNTSSMGPFSIAILVYHSVGLNVILDVYISFQPTKNDACSSSSFYLFLVNTFCRTTFESGILKELWVDSNYLGISGELPLVISLYFTQITLHYFWKTCHICILYAEYIILGYQMEANMHPSIHPSTLPYIPYHPMPWSITNYHPKLVSPFSPSQMSRHVVDQHSTWRRPIGE